MSLGKKLINIESAPDYGVVTSGLVLHWNANASASYPGTGNTIYDISNSGTAYNGTFVNTIAYTTDNGYNVLGTNGTNSYIYNTTLDLSSTDYTVMVGSRYTSISGRLLTAYGNNWLLGHWQGSINKYYAQGWISSSTIGGGDTDWRIYTGTGDISGDSYSLYSNNSSLYSNNGGSEGPDGIMFGRYEHPSDNEYGAGYLSFVLVYNRVLTTTEMTQNYNVFKDRLGL